MPPKTLFEKVWDSHVVIAPEGEPALLASLRDISDRKRLEEELKQKLPRPWPMRKPQPETV